MPDTGTDQEKTEAGRARLEEALLKRAQEHEQRAHLGRRRTLVVGAVSLALISVLMTIVGANLDDLLMRGAYFLAFAAGVGALFCLQMAFFPGE